MKILNQVESKLLNRVEITAIVEHTEKPTVTNQFAKEELAKSLRVDPKMLIIKGIHGVFGKGDSKVEAYLYKDKETLITLEGKDAIKEEPKVKEEPKIKTASEEVPTEEIKEENG